MKLIKENGDVIAVTEGIMLGRDQFKSRTISKRHGEIWITGDKTWYKDLGSCNGSSIIYRDAFNTCTPLTPNQPFELRDGMRLVLGKHLRAGSRIHTPVYLTVEIEKHESPAFRLGFSPDYDVSDEDRIDVDDDEDKDAFEEADEGDGGDGGDVADGAAQVKPTNHPSEHQQKRDELSDLINRIVDNDEHHIDSNGDLRDTSDGDADADADNTLEDAEPLHNEQTNGQANKYIHVESPTQRIPIVDAQTAQKRKRAIFAALHRASHEPAVFPQFDRAAPPQIDRAASPQLNTAVVPAQFNNVIGLIDSAIDARLDTKIDDRVDLKLSSAIAKYDCQLNKLGAQSFKNEMLIRRAMLTKRKKAFHLTNKRKNKLKRTKVAKASSSSSSSDNAASKSSSNAKGKLTAGVVGGVLGVGLGAAAMFTLLLNLD